LKVHGKSDKESFLHNGSHAAQGMPTLVHPAGVACLEFNLQKRKLQMGVQVLVSDPRKPEKIRERYVHFIVCNSLLHVSAMNVHCIFMFVFHIL
jgi:hypothetical protein